jgi:hypothetical protein
MIKLKKYLEIREIYELESLTQLIYKKKKSGIGVGG